VKRKSVVRPGKVRALTFALDVDGIAYEVTLRPVVERLSVYQLNAIWRRIQLPLRRAAKFMTKEWKKVTAKTGRFSVDWSAREITMPRLRRSGRRGKRRRRR
jgi:hypothetical protein